MSTAYLVTTANIIYRHGSHVLLLKRSEHAGVWTNYWCFPGGKVDAGELLRTSNQSLQQTSLGLRSVLSRLQ